MTPFEVTSRHFAGEPVEFATRDARTGRTFACVTSAFYGPKIFYTDDLAAEWQQADGVELPEDAEKPLERLWTVVPAEDDGHLYAGGAPGILFESHDGGASWELNKAFWEQPTRPDWSPGAGGMCMHSIATWPGDPSRVALAISAVGVWLTDDGGETWRNGNKNLYPRYMPEEAREDTITSASTTCTARRSSPSGSSCSSTEASTAPTTRARRGRRSPTASRPTSGSRWWSTRTTRTRAYVIPLVADMDRTTPDGKVRVYETRDAGASWIERGDGLPHDDAYLTILRQAFCGEGSGPTMGLYFGATSGDVFGSGDAGKTWFTAATNLPPVHSVAGSLEAARLDEARGDAHRHARLPLPVRHVSLMAAVLPREAVDLLVRALLDERRRARDPEPAELVARDRRRRATRADRPRGTAASPAATPC